ELEQRRRVLGVLVQRFLPGDHLRGLGLHALQRARERTRPLEAVHAVEWPALGGEEHDGGERLDAVLVHDLRRVPAALRVDLHGHEVAADDLDHRRLDVGGLVEAVAPPAPFRPEIHHDRLAGAAGLLERLLEAVLPSDLVLTGGGAAQHERDEEGRAHREAPSAAPTRAWNSGRKRASWSQNDSGCHCTPTTKRWPGISTPSTTPSRGLRAERTRSRPRSRMD